MARLAQYFGGGFAWAHAAWAAVGLGASLLLIFAGGTGHPPAIIFLPVVLLVWAIGHGLLIGIAWLVMRRGGTPLSPRHWPVGLVVALVGTGVVGFLGVVQLAVTVFLGELYPFRGTLWPVALVIAAVHAAGFIGLLLRRSWAKSTAAGLSLGWALLLGRQLADHLATAHRINFAEVGLVIVCIAVLGVLGLHLWRSKRIKAFFEAR